MGLTIRMIEFCVYNRFLLINWTNEVARFIFQCAFGFWRNHIQGLMLCYLFGIAYLGGVLCYIHSHILVREAALFSE